MLFRYEDKRKTMSGISLQEVCHRYSLHSLKIIFEYLKKNPGRCYI